MQQFFDIINHMCGFLSLPNNPFVQAAMGTALFFSVILALGAVASALSIIINLVLARAIGSVPAFISMNYLTWPGTVFHELSHALFIVLTGAKITHFSVLPKGRTLGRVEFVSRGGLFARSLQLSLSAVAPVICGAAAEILIFVLFPLCGAAWQRALLIYLAISILLHATLSSQDIKNFWRGLLPTSLTVYAIMLVLVTITPSITSQSFLTL